jgi:hypothetical protein
MKQHPLLIALVAALLVSNVTSAQIDLENLNPNQILGQVLKVEKGFSPKFYLGNTKIPKVDKLGQILGMKHNEEINKLYKTFKTGRTVFQIASYAGTAVTVYGLVKSIDKAATKKEYQTAIATGVTAIGTGVLIKLLTKGASYKAVDIFNNTVRNKLKDIFKIGAASDTMGVGLYVSL